MAGQGRGVYKHKPASDETREKARKAYYKWSGRKDPGNLLASPERLEAKIKELQMDKGV